MTKTKTKPHTASKKYDSSKFLYFISKEGHIIQKKRNTPKGVGKSIFKKNAVKREEGYLYFVKKGGTVGKAKMKRRGKK